MLQKIEISLEVPDGWELTGEFRPPKYGESYLTLDDDEVVTCLTAKEIKRFIVLKPFKLPCWIPYRWWVVVNPNRSVFAASKRPILGKHGCWEYPLGTECCFISPLLEAAGIKLPETHWEKAIWQQTEKNRSSD